MLLFRPDQYVCTKICAYYSSGKTMVHPVLQLRHRNADPLGSILWQKSNLFPAIKIKSRFPKKTIIKIPGSYQLVHHLRDLSISDTSSHTTIEDLAHICSAPWCGTNLKMVAKSLRPFLRESSFDFPAQIGYNRKYLLICKYLGI